VQSTVSKPYPSLKIMEVSTGTRFSKGEKKMSKAWSVAMGRQMRSTKVMAQASFGVFLFIEALRRNKRVTRKAGSKNPRESTMWTLQRLACWDMVKEGRKV